MSQTMYGGIHSYKLSKTIRLLKNSSPTNKDSTPTNSKFFAKTSNKPMTPSVYMNKRVYNTTMNKSSKWVKFL